MRPHNLKHHDIIKLKMFLKTSFTVHKKNKIQIKIIQLLYTRHLVLQIKI